MNDYKTFLVCDNSNISYNGNVSFGVADQFPIATLNSGASASFIFNGTDCSVDLLRYNRTGDLLLYLDGDFYGEFTSGLSNVYSPVSYLVKADDDGTHSLTLVAEGNTVRVDGRDQTSNVILHSIRSISYNENVRDFTNFSFGFLTLAVVGLVIVNLFKSFGIFGGDK